MNFKGIGASSGISIAKVFKLVDPNIVIERNDGVPAIEIERIKTAVDQTIEQINEIKDKVSKTLSSGEVKVFDAHIQVANDPMIMSEIHVIINRDLVNAPYALDQVFKKYIDMFSKMDDVYMKERAADIKDVYKRLISNLLGFKLPSISTINYEAIIVAKDLTPSNTAQIDRAFVKGFVTNVGGRTSHSAIMARSLEIPAVLGLGDITNKVQNNDLIIIDGLTGEVIINPSSTVIEEYKEKQIEYYETKQLEKEFLHKETLTKDNFKFELAANIGTPQDIANALGNGAEAIGLFRSEFLYMSASNWPTEESQFNEYRNILEQMHGKKVIFRTLDIGGDKKLNYFSFPPEDNPFLGKRAIRFCLSNLPIFKAQLRALIRASKYGKLAIMFPMIATINEFVRAKRIMTALHIELRKNDPEIPEVIEVGMMVEIPSVIPIIDRFAKYSDFFSIGTNDLIQYTMAADRMNERVAELYQPLNPSLLTMINDIVVGASKHKRWVGMCGEMAGEVEFLPILVGLGINELSMSASSILSIRKRLSEITKESAIQLVENALKLETEDQVLDLVRTYNENN